MFGLFSFGNHFYTLTATGLNFRTHRYNNREEATQAMYDIMSRKSLDLKEVYDDKHYKTYVCSDNVRFYINREF